jgi:hypothetical protein
VNTGGHELHFFGWKMEKKGRKNFFGRKIDGIAGSKVELFKCDVLVCHARDFMNFEIRLN